MNTHDKIELPPLPPGYKSYEFPDGGYDEDEMRTYACTAIEADRKRREEIEQEDRLARKIAERVAEFLKEMNTYVKEPERNNESYAQNLYDYNMQEDDEPCPVERLRFFCSNAMYHQDWLDSESYFEDILIKIHNLEEEIKMLREKDKSHFKHVGYQYKENGTWYPATLLQHTIEGNGWEIRKIYAEVNE